MTAGQSLWIGAATAFLVWLQRAFYFGAWEKPPAQPWETLRWLAVGTAGTLVMAPFYHNGGLGAGDAHWYAVMLSDFLAQLRTGVFPVWVGQSVDAFNGAVSTLRYAPGFQNFGGIMDMLTARALEPMAVRNATLAVVSLLGAFSCYGCLRSVARGKPWVACALAILWIGGPGVWAPVFVGDQYMTFTVVPFVPLVLYGCWRVWVFDDVWSRLWIAAGLAGSWICHPPIALWMTVISAAIYLPTLFVRRPWARQIALIVLMGAAFLVLGSLPFASVMTLDSAIKVSSAGAYAAEMVHTFFPANFLPITPTTESLAIYQVGYSLLGALVVSLVLLFWVRPRSAWAFGATAVGLVPFFVPIPWLSTALWVHLPGWFLAVENVWPTQRLFLVWSILAAFFSAIVLGSTSAAASRWKRGLLGAAFLGGLAWSVHEALQIIPRVGRTTAAETRVSYSPDNVLLTRYAYSSFEYAPAYFSHSYMEPWLENRLLDLHTLEPIVANADAAAPMPGPGAAQASDPRLVGSGLLTGVQIPNSSYYQLLPQLDLEPGRHYALRLEFLDPEMQGTLQMMLPGMFREYSMPDSGAGIKLADQSASSKAFGSGPANSHVVPLTVTGAGPYKISGMFIAAKRNGATYPFARYWLYVYDRAQLPVAVDSWIPYRATASTAAPCYLETPRMWLKGWEATVNGIPAVPIRSPENLVMVPLSAGASRVELRYRPPAIVAAAFWSAAIGWAGLGMLGLVQLVLFSGGSVLEGGTLTRPTHPRKGGPWGAL